MHTLRFTEQQKFNQVWWVLLIVFGTASLIWWGFIQQIFFDRPWGNNPGPDWLMWLMWLGIGIGLPLFFLLLKLVVEVYEDHLFIQYWPLTSRKIDFSEIVQVTTRTYSPIKEYGGWGIRGLSSGKKMAYNVKGNKGVELTLRGGRKVMIGSQRANELALAITVGIESSRPNTTA